MHTWTPVYDGDEVVGWVASGEYGYSVGAYIAHAYVRDESDSTGHEITRPVHGSLLRRRSRQGSAVGPGQRPVEGLGHVPHRAHQLEVIVVGVRERGDQAHVR